MDTDEHEGRCTHVTSWGKQCRHGALVHLLLAEQTEAGAPIAVALCGRHGHDYRMRHASNVIDSHLWRAGGSACGVAGAEWNHAERRCTAGETEPDPLWVEFNQAYAS